MAGGGGYPFVWSHVALAKTHMQGNLSHLINCKRKSSSKIFLMHSCSVNFHSIYHKKMGVFRVTFLGTELRVIGYVLRFLTNKIKLAVSCGNNSETPSVGVTNRG